MAEDPDPAGRPAGRRLAERLRGPGRVRRLLRVPVVGLLLAVVVVVGVVRVIGPPAVTAIPGVPVGGIEVGDRARGTYEVGRHTIVLAADALTVSHPGARTEVWASPRGRAFLVAAHSPTELRDGRLVRVTDQPDEVWAHQRIDGADVDRDGRLVISGFLTEEESEDSVAYQVFISSDPLDGGHLEVQAQVLDEEVNRLTLVTGTEAGEAVHGLGAQYAGWDLRGRVLPLLPRDQGIGRGQQPLSLLVDLFGRGAGAPETTTAPLPAWVTSAPRSLWAEPETLLVVDTRPAERIALTAWGPHLSVSMGVGLTPRAHVAAHARDTGLMRRPPGWVGEGLVVEVGDDADLADRVAEAGVPVAGVVLRPGAAGPAGWSVDPAGVAAVEAVAGAGARAVLLTASPLLDPAGERYAEAAEAGWLVTDADGAVVDVGDGLGMVDLLEPEAAAWLAEAIAADLLSEEAVAAGVRGFVAEGGAELPVDARVGSPERVGADAASDVATAWAEVGREALRLAGLEADGIVVGDAAGAGAAGAATMFSTAEQLVDFSRQDGLGSAFDGLLAAGTSGMSLLHHPVGGEVTLTLPGPLPDLIRSPELLVRSAELAVIEPMMRVAAGNRPDLGAQPDDPEVATHLRELVELFVALGPERARLAADAELRGLPLVRHPLLVVPELPEVTDQPDVVFLGEDVFAAPVLAEGVTERPVVLPVGTWVDVWTGEAVEVTRSTLGPTVVPAPLGRPPLWVRANTPAATDLATWRSTR